MTERDQGSGINPEVGEVGREGDKIEIK
jgi:hypothetical protein